jgi:hypothetical protein
MDAAALAQQLQTDARATTILLDALCALRVLDKKQGTYRVPTALVPALTEGSPDSILPGLRHLANCQRRWSQLAHVVRDGGPAEVGPSVRGPEGDLISFIGAMQNYCLPIIDEVVTRTGLPPCHHLLDIGGASGHWTAGFLRAYPEARATLFDRPQVIPLARQHLTALGMNARVTLVAGDYNTDALPTGADVAWLSAIAHQNSRAENRALFVKIHTALAPGGTLLIRDIILDETRTTPIGGALFAVNMLVATAAGNSYTLTEYQEDLTQAGFRNITLLHADEGMNALVKATA